ncbi:glycoside hydrolase family 3 protein [Streptosporangium canum]|uniref:glycoside hydrolase family 3 protein n=1 Tax=Streptosporangium canum TaxID=324952 RepID=UPI0036857198
MRPIITTSPDGIAYRDLNGNSRMDPYEDPRLTAEERTADLLARLSLEEKVGLMFHPVIEAGPDGALLESAGPSGRPPTSEVVCRKLINHFNVHHLGEPRLAARWMNALQALAEATSPHGIPITVSTDPRHAFMENSEVSWRSTGFSQWPEALGLAAIDDLDTIRRFAEVARAEYLAVGIRSALHPQIDLATEPRWARQAGTFGVEAQRVGEYVRAYLAGFQGETIGPDSVSCVTKHFPGGGPQADGEDPHFPYGRDQVYPGDNFEYHLKPFRAAIDAGTVGLMPYYGRPIGLVRRGEKIEEVGFGFNKQIMTGLLREELGFQGVIVTDWKLVEDRLIDGRVFPARAWGVEQLDAEARVLKVLDAGCDQFGGEDFTDRLIGLVRDGRVPESRIDESARRLLLVKFRLGLFDNPYVDEDHAAEIVGNPEFRRAGFVAQARSVTVLEDNRALPIRCGLKLYLENVDPEIAAGYGTVVTDPAEADLGIIRLAAPYEPRDDIPMERKFHQGSLEFPPGLTYRLAQLSTVVPLVVDVALERPAILTPLTGLARVLVGTFGTGDAALFAALTGEIRPEGALPVEIPRSMDAVRSSRPDMPADTDDPVYPLRAGRRVE